MINNKEKDIKDFNPADHILDISFLFFLLYVEAAQQKWIC